MNIVADALSRRDAPDAMLHAISLPSFDLLDDIKLAADNNEELSRLRTKIEAGTLGAPWSVVNGLVLYQNRIFVPAQFPFLPAILSAAHDDNHEGIQRTLHRLNRYFHVPAARKLVQDFVRACVICQKNKTELMHHGGLLQPLPVPSAVWQDISLDFVEGLPKVAGKSVILTVVDRFSKYAHFIPLGHPYTAESVARAFFDEIVRLHGIPVSIVSDRDPVFTSSFWRALFKASGSTLLMSSAFHPQTDGQTEAVNKAIGMYLRCFTGDRPRQWLKWLPWAEYTYNTAFHTSLKETPFRVVYGRDPPSLRSYDASEVRVVAVAQTLAERDEFLQDVRLRLEQAQQVAKLQYDGHHRAVTFSVGDWVWLRLHHRPHGSLAPSSSGKLRQRYFGPYKIVEEINSVAFRLDLPQGARLHNVFHVGLLKKFVGTPPAAPPQLPPVHHGAIVPQPSCVLRLRFEGGTRQALVQWEGLPPSAASWEDLDKFQMRCPQFQLEDELLLKGGSDVMWGKKYGRHKRLKSGQQAPESSS
jgi:transposase InsO family protein